MRISDWSSDVCSSDLQQLRPYIERIERLEEEKKGLSEDIKDVFAEAKGNGFDVKTMRQIIKIRKMDASEREAQEALTEACLGPLDMPCAPEDASLICQRPRNEHTMTEEHNVRTG